MNRCRGRYAIRGAPLALLIACAPAWGQSTNSAAPATNQAAPATNGAADVVGPRELQNFSLGGTVTRPAEPAPTATPAPAPTRAAPAESTARSATPAAPDRARAAAPAGRSSASAAPVGQDRAPAPAPVELLPPPSSLIDPPAESPSAAEAELLADQDGAPMWPWWLAALALAAGAGLLLWRRRQQHAEPAMAGMAHGFVAPEPRAVPPAAAPTPPPAPAPAPAPRAPRRPVDDGAIVSRALQPRIGFEFKPLKLETDADGGAALIMEVVVANQGSAPARDVLVEAFMVNAGPSQDDDIGYFFRNPVAHGDRLPLIPPMGRVTLRTRAVISPDRLKPLEVDGRKLLVPMVAFNALYRSGASDAQSSASFLVGRGGEDGGKMGAFALDRGPRAWSALGVRPHSAGLQR